MKNLRGSVAAWTGLGLGLLMTACGGGGGGGTTTPPPAAGPTITSITVTPNTAIIGTQVQFTATVAGTGSFSSAVTWSVAAPSGSVLSPGTLSTNGLYTTPYPAPPTVKVTATSTQDTSKSGSATVTLSQPAMASGPALTVDAGDETHAISPLIYGMNAYQLLTTAAASGGITVDRWGGDATSRYNYLLDVTSSASDWYFENQVGMPGGSKDNSSFNAQVANDASVGAKTIGTVPVNGWVAKDSTSCSFPSSTYAGQVAVDSGRGCGNGVYNDGAGSCTNAKGCNITGIDPTLTSTAVDAAWAGNWVTYLKGKFGSAANGGVAIYDLDNEPSWWDAVHRDVHPAAFTYDEVTNNGIAAAKAVKTADPTAEVSGPVMDYWWAYFYSKKDIEAGWGTGPCYQPWQSPADRTAHGGVPLIEYYLQQFAADENVNHVRLLDYLDLHTYFTPQFPLNSYNSIGFGTAGDTEQQQLRLNSTRVFWDPTYVDPDTDDPSAGQHYQPFPQPNYLTDANYTPNCYPPAQAPRVIRMMHDWVAKDYPGTKTAITEYNWGGQEHVNGALAQADILGIFGREGLDLGTLWGPPDPSKGQTPGLVAFEVFRNYDGAKSAFGDMALASTSGDQGKLSVYGALRTSDNKVTIVVLNKTYGDLTATLSLANMSPNGQAEVFLYSNAHIEGIVTQPNLTVTPPAAGSTTSTVSATFPAQSITILVVPKL